MAKDKQELTEIEYNLYKAMKNGNEKEFQKWHKEFIELLKEKND